MVPMAGQRAGLKHTCPKPISRILPKVTTMGGHTRLYPKMTGPFDVESEGAGESMAAESCLS